MKRALRRLFARWRRSSFLLGLGSVVDLRGRGSYGAFRRGGKRRNASDWEAVGEELRRTMGGDH